MAVLHLLKRKKSPAYLNSNHWFRAGDTNVVNMYLPSVFEISAKIE